MAAIVFWVMCFGYSNYSESIKPHLSTSNNPYLIQAKDISKHTHPGDIVVLSGMGDEACAEVYIPYFAHRYVFSIHTEMERRKDNQLTTKLALQALFAQCRTHGGHVYGLNELWNSKGVRDGLLERHKLTPLQLDQMFTGQKIKTAWKDPRGSYVWIITPG